MDHATGRSFVAQCLAAVVSGAMQGGTRNVVQLPAAHDFDSDRRAPGAPRADREAAPDRLRWRATA